MDTESDFDSLDRALTRATARHASPPLDPRQLRRRQLRLELGPCLWLLTVLGLVAAAVYERSWWLAAGLGIGLLPGAILQLVGRHREVAALGAAGDFVAYERTYFTAQANHQRAAVLLEATLALVFAIVAWRTGDAWRWSVPALFGAIAIGRAVIVLPYVERARRDTGGERAYPWTMQVLVFALFLLSPLLLALGVVRRRWAGLRRRLGGRR